MAYDRYTWVDGEVITAQKLNHIEEGIAEGGDAGYECTETAEELFEETITTSQGQPAPNAYFVSHAFTNADTLIVTFDGEEYVCEKNETPYGNMYGGYSPSSPVFSEYPFLLAFANNANPQIYTENPQTSNVKVVEISQEVTTTPCFEKAVKSVSDAGYKCKSNEYIDATITTEDKGYNCGEIAIQGVFINAPTITVVYDGTEYTAKGTDASGGTGQAFFYGDNMRDFSTLPFYIYSGGGSTYIYTQTVGEHTIKITGDTIETTDCFKAAIAKAAPSNIIVSKTRYFSNNTGEMYDSEYPKDFISTPDDTFLLLLEEQSTHTRYAAILGWSTSQSDISAAWRGYNYVSLGDNALSLSDILKMFPANHADALQNKDFHPQKMQFYVPTASKTYSIMLIKLTN